MTKAHIICSTNPPPRREDKDAWPGSVKPLETLMNELQTRELDIKRLVFVSSNTKDDLRWCELAKKMIESSPWPTAAIEPRYASSPLQIASMVSQELELADRHDASLIADLTLGPKDRSSAIYVASSALQSVTILYAERHADGYRHREIPPIGDFNQWLSRHGVVIRDYKQELAGLNVAVANQQDRCLTDQELALSIADMLISSDNSAGSIPGPRANLLTLMEAVRNSVWVNVMECQRPQNGAAEDEGLRDRRQDEWHRSAGRAAQALWVLRGLFAHGQPESRHAERPDAMAALDILSFLSARLRSAVSNNVYKPESNTPSIIVALDGDDVGRRFEERLACCTGMKEMNQLAEWSYSIQADLSLQMLTLQDRWDAVFLARTGDGFLARLPAANLDDLKLEFRPMLLDLSATVGVGPTVKDAYLALKLGKAKNRGGGLYYSATGEETVLWENKTQELSVGGEGIRTRIPK